MARGKLQGMEYGTETLPTRRTILPLLYLALIAALPCLSLLGDGGGYLADPFSELPVKLWVFETFGHSVPLLGGVVEGIGHPASGALNNPDVVGTLLMSAFRPLLGGPGAYNGMVVLQLWASMAACWLLARDLTRDHRASLMAAVVFGLSPLVLVYCVAGAVTDMLNLWPYPLAIFWLLRAMRRGNNRDALLGGAAVGVGVIICPYNAVIFSALAVPLLALLPWIRRSWLTLSPDPEATARPVDWLRVGLLALLAAGLTGGAYLLWLRGLMADPSSLMSDEQVASTRHAAPWPFLEPLHQDRYVAYLMDYLAVGKEQLVVRETGSRYFRAFSTGLLVPSLALLGLLASRGRRWVVGFWLVVAAFFAVASTGPFLPLASDLSLPGAYNPVWMGVFHLLPGSSMILEPFRYALGVSLALGLASAVGVVALQRRFGAWVGWVLPGVFVLELALLSPVPVPLPTSALEPDPAYAALDEVLPPGAIIELPYFTRGSHRFERVHFLNQVTHGRAIPDEVTGFLPRYLLQNHLSSELIELERCSEHLLIRDHDMALIDIDRQKLVDDGFVGIVVDHNAYENDRRRDAVMALLGKLSHPTRHHGRAVFSLVSTDNPPTSQGPAAEDPVSSPPPTTP